METLPDEDWETLFDEYRPEMIEELIKHYELSRNKDLPEECNPYAVDRKRYNDDLWFKVITEHRSWGLCPYDTILISRDITGGKSPWPSLFLRIPRIICNDHRIELTTLNTEQLTLGYIGGSATKKTLREKISRLDVEKIEVTAKTLGGYFVLQLVDSTRWPWLLNENNGRHLVASILLFACSISSRKKLIPLVHEDLSEFCEMIRNR